MLVMAALKDALSDSSTKTRKQAADYFAAAFGDAAQMCPAKTGQLLTLFGEHLLTYRGEDVSKHGRLLLAFLEDVPSMWLSYSSSDLSQVFAIAKMIIMTAKLSQVLYRLDPSAKWWALWTLPRFARMKLVSLLDWDSANVYRPYFDVLIARLYMFADSRKCLAASHFDRLVEAAIGGNAHVADYLKRGGYAGNLDWARRAVSQLRIFLDNGNVEATVALCKIISLAPLTQDLVAALSPMAQSASDYRVLRELVSVLRVKEAAGVILYQYHRGMEPLAQSGAGVDYFLAACVSTLKEIASEPSGAETVLASPHAKDFILRLGCDLLETYDLRSAYILSIFSLFPTGRRLINDCKVFPALVKHLCTAAETRDETRVRDLLPVVRAVAWLERTLLEEPDRTSIQELVGMKSHACNWESEEAGKSVYSVLESAWVLRNTIGDRFDGWSADTEGLGPEDMALFPQLPCEKAAKSTFASPLLIYSSHLSPRPAVTVQATFDPAQSFPLSQFEAAAHTPLGTRICNYLKTEGLSPFAIVIKWREYHYLNVLPGARALRLARTESEQQKQRVEWGLLEALVNVALSDGKPVTELAGSRFATGRYDLPDTL